MNQKHPRIGLIPNLLSLSRIIMAPLMVISAWLGSERSFTTLYAASLVTDAIDGFIARHFHVESPMGATLDSRGDLAVALCLPISALLLWPAFIRSLVPYILVALVAYLAPCVAGCIRYGRLPSFHTWGAKIVAVVLGISLLTMFITHNSFWFRIFIPLIALESIEEMIMIALLPKWTPNTPSLWHAIQIRKELRSSSKT